MSMFDDFDEDLVDDGEGFSGQSGINVTEEGLLAPRLMSECHGHDNVESQLCELISSEHLPHALIFAGPEGIGKSTMAFRMARFLLKKGIVEDSGGGLFGEALPVTEPPRSLDIDINDQVFRMVASAGHPDLLTVEREYDEKKGRFKGAVGIDPVRRIAPFMRRTASFGGWRVAIIDDADTMTNEAQNAILKILEEPPAHALLIVVCHRPGMMIPTIRSRCRMINFTSLDIAAFSKILRLNDASLREPDILTLHAITGGSAGQALRLLEEGGLEVIYKVSGLLGQWPTWDWPQIHGLADNLSKPGQEDSYKSFTEILMWAAESLLKARVKQEALPASLAQEQVVSLANYYSVEVWLDIISSLKQHFATADISNLDKRQAILGAFNIFEEARKAA